MGSMRKIFGFIMFGFAVITIIGMGILTKAVIEIQSKSYYNVTPFPNATSPQDDVKVISLDSNTIIIARIAVVCFWIFLFFGIFGVKAFF